MTSDDSGDLFGRRTSAELPGKNGPRSSRRTSRTFPPVRVEVRKFGGELSALRSAGKFAKTPEHEPSTHPGTGDDQKFGDLLEQRSHLENEIERLTVAFEAADGKQIPFSQAFWQSHQALLDLHERRRDGAWITKAIMLAGYDERMAAGHAWHPYRKAAADLALALKATKRDLAEVNRKIGT